MFPEYDDITSRIEEEPTWYTIEGFPRYGKFEPRQCNIYSRYSILMKIECQSCGKEFLIGQDFDPYSLYQFLLDSSVLYDTHFSPDAEIWLSLIDNVFAPVKKDAEGNKITRTLTIDELVKNWGFGDPPNHGCVGDTMSCIERCSVEVWDSYFGRTTEQKEGTNYSVITNMGSPQRLTELEGIDLTPPWVE